MGPADECVLSYGRPTVDDGVVSWTGALSGDRPAKAFVEFTWLGRRLRPTARPWLLAFLPIAMRSGHRRIVLDGPIDEGTLMNLREWQELHHHWWPKSTRIVEIRGEVEPEPRVPRGAGALMCFSGGVDSTFTLLRQGANAPAEATYRRAEVSAALMVHGFDIAHRDDTTFTAAWERSVRMLRAHGVTPLRMRTNLRRAGRKAGLGWGKVAHGPALVSALAFVEQAHDRVIVPSSYPYRLPRKWGSTPVGDPLLGSGDRPLWHDGAAHDKLDKVLAIAHDPAIAADLRVCFIGDRLDRNCGACFKCMVTQACFWIAGVDDPPAFERRATMDEIAALDMDDPYRFELSKRIIREARRRERDDVAAAFAAAVDRVDGAPTWA